MKYVYSRLYGKYILQSVKGPNKYRQKHSKARDIKDDDVIYAGLRKKCAQWILIKYAKFSLYLVERVEIAPNNDTYLWNYFS